MTCATRKLEKGGLYFCKCVLMSLENDGKDIVGEYAVQEQNYTGKEKAY